MSDHHDLWIDLRSDTVTQPSAAMRADLEHVRGEYELYAVSV